MADALKDLAIVPITSSDTNYFLRKVTGLKIDKTYSFKFQWVLEDGTVSDWSPGYQIVTPTENVPSAPSVTVPTTSTGSIPVTLSLFPANAKRVDIYVIGGEFGTGKVADYFLSAGTKSIAVAGGTYQVSLITVTPSNINGDPTNTFTINVSTAGETIQAPTNPNGFSIDRVLSGIQVNWSGTYANGTFTGFEAIKIYVGTGPTFTTGTYREAGVMTGNNVKNTITVPVDGTYLRYDQPVYIHAAAVNKNGTLGTVQANVANNSLGARSAIASDLADQIITNAKIVDDAVTAAKILTGSITTTKIADDAITTAKLVANAITADKIVSSAITADKIATNAITAGKILAGEIGVSKLAAGTISVNNLEAGTLSSTSYIRAGGSTGARVELSSSAIASGPAAGFYIYNSDGAAILSAPLTGGLSIVGNGTFTGNLAIGTSPNIFKAEPATGIWLGGSDGTYANSNFSVSTTGILKALSGTIGGWKINSTQLRSNGANQISLNQDTPKIALIQGATLNGATGLYEGGTEKITIDPVEGIKDSAGNFSLTPAGVLTLKGSITSGSTITGATITSSKVTSTGSFTDIYGNSVFGTLTIDGGSVSTTTGLYIDSAKGLSVNIANNAGYMQVGLDGRAWIGQGGTYSTLIGASVNSLNFTVNPTNTGDGYRGRGYNMLNLDAAEFRAPSQHVSNSYNYPTVVVGFFGELMNGRAFWYGSAGTSTAINSAITGNLGDIYFSTS